MVLANDAQSYARDETVDALQLSAEESLLLKIGFNEAETRYLSRYFCVEKVNKKGFSGAVKMVLADDAQSYARDETVDALQLSAEDSLLLKIGFNEAETRYLSQYFCVEKVNKKGFSGAVKMVLADDAQSYAR